jgi:uncharacterized lipoprotein YehR (DUF1307 family)
MTRVAESRRPHVRRSPRLRAISGAALVCAASVVGCGQSKTTQCNRLIEKVNATTASIAASLNKVQQTDDAVQLDQMAELLDKTKQEVVALELEDAKLKGLAGQYGTMLDGIAKSARSMAKAKRDTDSEAFATAEKSFESVGDEETRIVDALNTYCNAK